MDVIIDMDPKLVEAARAKAQQRDAQLGQYIVELVERDVSWTAEVRDAMAALDEMRKHVHTGGQKFSREEMNER